MTDFLGPAEQSVFFLGGPKTILSLLHWIPLQAGEAHGFTWRIKQPHPELFVFVPSRTLRRTP
jgi:hypothetical protein